MWVSSERVTHNVRLFEELVAEVQNLKISKYQKIIKFLKNIRACIYKKVHVFGVFLLYII